MPIYEYRCGDCNRKVSLFYRSISAAEAGAGEERCPNCGSAKLSRLISKIAVLRNTAPETSLANFQGGGEFDAGSDFVDEDGYTDAGGGMTGMPNLDQMMAGVDEDDPRSVARWAKQMQSQMGEDLGPEFNTAISRIEAGEDPDNVLDDLGPEMGMAGPSLSGDLDE